MRGAGAIRRKATRSASDEIRLAPLYDLSSQLPYSELIAQRVAMKIGEHYDIGLVGLADWQNVARACALAEEGLIAMVTAMAKALPDEISAASAQAVSDGLSQHIIAPLAEELIRHARTRLASITRATATRGVHSRRDRHRCVLSDT